VTKILKSKFKASRRHKVSIWGSDKDAFHTRNYRPGQHGASGQVKVSDYGIHLNAKQKLKKHYGMVTERQFKNLFKLAAKKKGNTGENFIGLLESRLDIIVYRMNLAPTIFAARQLVNHKHVKVNGKVVNIPSCRVSIGDEIELTDSAKKMFIVEAAVNKMERAIPDYLSFDPDTGRGKFFRVPQTSDVPYPFDPEINLIIEFYSH